MEVEYVQVMEWKWECYTDYTYMQCVLPYPGQPLVVGSGSSCWEETGVCTSSKCYSKRLRA